MFEKWSKRFTAFGSGYQLAKQFKDIPRTEDSLGELESWVRREDPWTIASTAAGVGVSAWVIARRRDLRWMWAAGAILGSGVLKKGWDRVRRKAEGEEQAEPVTVRVDRDGHGSSATERPATA